MQPFQLPVYSYEARENCSSSEHGQDAWGRLMFHHRVAREGPEVEYLSNRKGQSGLVQPHKGLVQPLLGLVRPPVLARHRRSGLI